MRISDVFIGTQSERTTNRDTREIISRSAESSALFRDGRCWIPTFPGMTTQEASGTDTEARPTVSSIEILVRATCVGARDGAYCRRIEAAAQEKRGAPRALRGIRLHAGNMSPTQL